LREGPTGFQTVGEGGRCGLWLRGGRRGNKGKRRTRESRLGVVNREVGLKGGGLKYYNYVKDYLIQTKRNEVKQAQQKTERNCIEQT